MKNLKENPFGKFNGNEQKYAIQALDSTLSHEKSFNLKFEEGFKKKEPIACNQINFLSKATSNIWWQHKRIFKSRSGS